MPADCKSLLPGLQTAVFCCVFTGQTEGVRKLSAVAAAKSLQLCPTLCDPIDGSLPGSPVPGILQARILEWVAMPFSRGSSQPTSLKSATLSGEFFTTGATWEALVYGLLLLLLLSHFSRVQLCATPQTAAHQAPPSLRFSRQEQWSGLPFPSPMHACMLSRFSHI